MPTKVSLKLGLLTALLLAPGSASAQELPSEAPPSNVPSPTWQPAPPQPEAQPPQQQPEWQPPPQPQPEAQPPPQLPAPPQWQPPSPSPTPLGARVRLEVGMEGGLILAFVPSSGFAQNGGGGMGMYFRIGTQFNEWFATQFEVSANTILLINSVRGALTASFTPARRWTLSVGPCIGALAAYQTGATSYAGVSVRSDFHLYQHRTASGRRHSITLGIGGDFGGTFGSNMSYYPYPSLTGGGLIDIGYTLH